MSPSTMRTAQDLFIELNALDESTHIEAKTCTQIGKSIMESVCAFANEPQLNGGYLLLGVQRKEQTLFGPQYEIVGIENPDQLQSDLASQCASVFNTTLRPQIRVESLQEKPVIVAYIPELSPAEKPVFFQKQGLPKGAFRRIGPTDQCCTDDDLIPLYTGRQVETYDMSLIPDGTIADLDPQAIEDYRTQRAKANPAAEELSWSDTDLLHALSATRSHNNQAKPTIAGLLLFGTPIALRRCFPMMRIDYIRIPGREWVADPDKRFDTLEIRAPLLLAIRRAINTVADDLLRSFSLAPGELQSEQQTVLPLRVIREAIVNAVMHRSYRTHGAIQIIRYANRIEIRNPGHSLKAEDALGQPGSETRNPKIAAVLHEIHAAETKGSGIRVMRELMQDHDLMPPTFESTRQPDQFVTTLLFHHLLGEQDLQWVRNLTTDTLTPEEIKTLIFVREVGAINNAAYREINAVDTLSASTHLRRLRDIGLLAMKGSGSKTYYVPGKYFTTNQTNNTHQADSNTHQVNPNTHQVPASPPANILAILPKPGSKPRKEEIRHIVQQLCSWKALSANEIAAHLGRKSTKDLVRDHLTPMLEEGILNHTIPEMPSHPEQKYTNPP